MQTYTLIPVGRPCPDADKETNAGTKDCFACSCRRHGCRYSFKELAVACAYGTNGKNSNSKKS